MGVDPTDRTNGSEIAAPGWEFRIAFKAYFAATFTDSTSPDKNADASDNEVDP